MRALRPDPETRYQRAEEILDDILAARDGLVRRPTRTPVPASGEITPARGVAAASPARTSTPRRTAETVANRFCWNCRKPLPSRAARCPFCSESQ